MGVSTFADLLAHAGHRVRVTTYGNAGSGVVNVAVECVSCGTVLFDFDRDGDEDEGAGVEEQPRLDAVALRRALVLAYGIGQQHNLLAGSASEAERSATIERLLRWWNQVALPALGEQVPEWLDTTETVSQLEQAVLSRCPSLAALLVSPAHLGTVDQAAQELRRQVDECRGSVSPEHTYLLERTRRELEAALQEAQALHALVPALRKAMRRALRFVMGYLPAKENWSSIQRLLDAWPLLPQ